MLLVELRNEAVLAEDLFVVGFGDANEVVELSLLIKMTVHRTHPP